MTRHVEMLTRAGPHQIKRYTNAIRNHFGGRLGKLPWPPSSTSRPA
jgi:hypothetical protein